MHSSPKTSSQFLNCSGPPPCSSWQFRYCPWHFRCSKLNNGSTFLYISESANYIHCCCIQFTFRTKQVGPTGYTRSEATSNQLSFYPSFENASSWDLFIVRLSIYQWIRLPCCSDTHPTSFILYKTPVVSVWIFRVLNACTILSLSSRLPIRKSLYVYIQAWMMTTMRWQIQQNAYI